MTTPLAFNSILEWWNQNCGNFNVGSTYNRAFETSHPASPE